MQVPAGIDLRLQQDRAGGWTGARAERRVAAERGGALVPVELEAPGRVPQVSAVLGAEREACGVREAGKDREGRLVPGGAGAVRADRREDAEAVGGGDEQAGPVGGFDLHGPARREGLRARCR